MKPSHEILEELKRGQVDEMSRLVIYMLTEEPIDDWRRDSLDSVRENTVVLRNCSLNYTNGSERLSDSFNI